MFTIFSASQVNQIEKTFFDRNPASQTRLMETAGTRVFQRVSKWAQENLGDQLGCVHILCGPGNNGGDGYVVARLLHRNGVRVAVKGYGNPAKRSEAASQMRQEWLAVGRIGSLCEISAKDFLPGDLVVDALFGIGLCRPLRRELSSALSRIPEFVPVISIDICSGLHADTGRILVMPGNVFRPANHTVTMQCAKPGHFLAEGADATGRLEVVSIGLEEEFEQAGHRRRYAAMACTVADLEDMDVPAKLPGQHKYHHGHALVLSGACGRGGAARLAAHAALRVGAGLVTVGAPADAMLENAAQLNAIMLTRVDTGADLNKEIHERRISTICLGPGLGCGARTRDLVSCALAAGQGVVIDADGLTSFAGNPGQLFSILHEQAILTPHMGEFGRLFPDLHESMATADGASKLDVVVKASSRSGCVILLKGHDTVIATPDGEACICSSAREPVAAYLATAGAGDVLAGLITGLMARQMRPFAASRLAVLLHIAAARDVGPGLIAEDLAVAAGRRLGQLAIDRLAGNRTRQPGLPEQEPT